MDLSINNEIEKFAEFMYEDNSWKLKKSVLLSQKNENFTFPWNQSFIDKDTLQKYLDTLKENISIRIENDSFHGTGLRIQSYLLEDQNKDLFDLFAFDLIKSKITNQKNEIVEIDKHLPNINLAFEQECNFKNKKITNSRCKILDINFNIPTLESSALKGELVFNARFISGYTYKKITPDEYNTPIVLNNIAFTVVDIVENKIVIAHKNTDDELLDSVSFVNVDNKGNSIESIPYPWDVNLEERIWRGNNRSAIFEYNYAVFKNNPELSFKDYKKMITKKLQRVANSDNKDEVFKKEFGEDYVIFDTVNLIENLYFYVPNYVQIEFEMQLK
ncbi:hypothetical protein N8Z33_01400 [Flavobacteriaceae bacterium]|nr:hypothetical protein [Flavobacteriaceae bacterium]